MIKLLNILKKEPLIHFLVLGVILVIINYYYSQETENTLTISKTALQQYFNSIRGENTQGITMEDSLELTDAYITNQVLLAEAVKRKYDKYDPIIRKRMIELMRVSLTDEINPDDEELRDYYEQHQLQYSMFDGISFLLVTFDKDNVPAADSLDRLTASLYAYPNVDFPVSQFHKKSRFELMRAFGMAFSRNIDGLETKKWLGPIRSSKGSHLAYVEEKHYSDVLPFETVKAQVISDYTIEMSKRSFEKNFSKIESKYKIRIDSIR